MYLELAKKSKPQLKSKCKPLFTKKAHRQMRLEQRNPCRVLSKIGGLSIPLLAQALGFSGYMMKVKISMVYLQCTKIAYHMKSILIHVKDMQQNTRVSVQK